MLRLILFNGLFVGSCGYALLRGGAPERIAAALLALNFELSYLALPHVAARFSSFQGAVFAIDLATLACLFALGAASSRFWPIWLAGLQGAVVLSHLLGAAPGVIAWTYSWAVAAWSYPMLVLLAVATWRHRRRLARYGMDPAWHWQQPLAYRRGEPADEAVARPA